jgi:hypothetical protein
VAKLDQLDRKVPKVRPDHQDRRQMLVPRQGCTS